MQCSTYIATWGLLFLPLITALPRLLSPIPSRPGHVRRDIPNIPPRPDGVGPNSFHGSQFAFFDDIGFVAGSPAVEAAPVFLYSRTDSSDDPCYPESAIVLGSNPHRPNPGTDGPKGTASYNPGADCTNPGPYHGAYSLGNDFPVYSSASWCGRDSVWKLNYDLYYVHDGNLEAGHKHDWEGVTIVFARDPAAKGDDWWHRAGAQYNHHSKHDWFKYSDLITVAVDTRAASDISNDVPGLMLNHPKVYIGFYSHSAYDRKDTSIRVNADPMTGGGFPEQEIYILTKKLTVSFVQSTGKTFFSSLTSRVANWNYGSADSTPPKNHDNMCGWGIGELS